MEFKPAIENGTAAIRTAYYVGLTALGNNSKRVSSEDPRR